MCLVYHIETEGYKGKKLFIFKNYSDLKIFASSNIKPDLEILMLFTQIYIPYCPY